MIGLGRPVGQAVERNTGHVQLFQQRNTILQDSAQGFRPLPVEGTDEVGMIGIQRDQLRLAFRDGPSAILLEVPVGRADMRQEPAPPRFVGNELAIEIIRAPVEQNAAEIEHHRPDVGHPEVSVTAVQHARAMLEQYFPVEKQFCSPAVRQPARKAAQIDVVHRSSGLTPRMPAADEPEGTGAFRPRTASEALARSPTTGCSLFLAEVENRSVRTASLRESTALVVRAPSGKRHMIFDVNSVSRNERHSFAQVDHQNAALSQEKRQSRSLV
jgi:hypothetical protein